MRTARARHRRQSANGENFAGAEENEMTFLPRRILLATDGSEEAELAARVAVELAKSTGSEDG